MPRPTSSTRIVISGSLPGGEAFAWGFWLNEAPVDNTVAAGAAAAIASAFQSDLLPALSGFISSDCSYDRLDLYGYNSPTGPASTQANSTIASGTGVGSGSSHPLQVGMVCSLHTERPGRRGRGRMYFPVTALTLTAHQATQSHIDGVTAAVAAFFHSVNISVPVNGQVSVISQVDGLAYPVTAVSADSRLDIQRRRAQGEAELYQSSEDIV